MIYELCTLNVINFWSLLSVLLDNRDKHLHNVVTVVSLRSQTSLSLSVDSAQDKDNPLLMLDIFKCL